MKPDLILSEFKKLWHEFRCCYGLDEAVSKYRFSTCSWHHKSSCTKKGS